MLARTAKHALAITTRAPYKIRGCPILQPLRRPLKPYRAASTLAAPASVDDLQLVSVFDQPTSSRGSSGISYTGLFGEEALTTPGSFRALANATIRRAQLITDRVVRARQSREEMLRVVKNLDRLSDMLCGVIDMAELVRNAHPDTAWITCADEVYDKLCEYMNTLNVNVELYEVRYIRRNPCGSVS
jgi:intermediate peptidase